jgi:hypothetical protein
MVILIKTRFCSYIKTRSYPHTKTRSYEAIY